MEPWSLFEPNKWSFYWQWLEILRGFALRTIRMLAKLTASDNPYDFFQTCLKIVPFLDLFVGLETTRCPAVIASQAFYRTAFCRLRGTTNSMCGTLLRKLVGKVLCLLSYKTLTFPDIAALLGSPPVHRGGYGEADPGAALEKYPILHEK